MVSPFLKSEPKHRDYKLQSNEYRRLYWLKKSCSGCIRARITGFVETLQMNLRATHNRCALMAHMNMGLQHQAENPFVQLLTASCTRIEGVGLLPENSRRSTCRPSSNELEDEDFVVRPEADAAV